MLRLDYAGGLLYAAMQEAGIAIYETTSVGVHEQPVAAQKQKEFHVWPSVTDGNVCFMLGVPTRVSDFALYDVSGKRIENVRLRVSVKGGETQGMIDLTGHAAGVYVVRVEFEGNRLTTKVVKTDRR